MSIFRSVIGTPFVFSSVDLSAASYLTAIDSTETKIMATLTSDGIRISTDSGQTWGSTIATGVGGPWGLAFRAPRAAGTAPAGRIWLLQPAGVAANTAIHFTDDEGGTVSAEVLPSAISSSRGAKMIQSKAPDNILLLNQLNEVSGLFRSTDGGATWDTISDPETQRGIGLDVREDGFIYWHGFRGTAETQFAQKRSTDGGATFGAFSKPPVVLSAPNELSLRTDYHRADNVIGIAVQVSAGKFNFITMNATETYVIEALVGTGTPTIIGVDWVAAVQGISGKWVVSVNTSTSKSQLWASADGDPTTWALEKEFDIGTAAEGLFTNLIQFGA